MKEKFKFEPFGLRDLEDAIFVECGTDDRTVKAALEKLLRLNLIEEVIVEVDGFFGKTSTKKYKISNSNPFIY